MFGYQYGFKSLLKIFAEASHSAVLWCRRGNDQVPGQNNLQGAFAPMTESNTSGLKALLQRRNSAQRRYVLGNFKQALSHGWMFTFAFVWESAVAH
jgi:hypothetical protein